MKLLFDENLPGRLVELLTDSYPRCASVTILGLGERADGEIVQYAKDHGFIVVTKDIHFYQRCVAHGYPPKVVWVRTGNSRVEGLVETFRRARERLERFELDDEPYLILR